MREVTKRFYDMPTIRRFAAAIKNNQTVTLKSDVLEPISHKVFPDSVEFICRVVGHASELSRPVSARLERTKIISR
ncbi:hypothetical protein [Vibrio parahaemolyticus]|uniref:hypothetical protein n=1 Tax=Vibrio parahaemolyticus TaxID=670 RepID=UPI003D81837F